MRLVDILKEYEYDIDTSKPYIKTNVNTNNGALKLVMNKSMVTYEQAEEISKLIYKNCPIASGRLRSSFTGLMEWNNEWIMQFNVFYAPYVNGNLKFVENAVMSVTGGGVQVDYE